MVDVVNHPPHYTTGTTEVLDFILDQKFGYLDGQVIKYVSRCRHKNNALEDLKKAEFYLKRLIKQYEDAIPATTWTDALGRDRKGTPCQ